MKPAPLLRLDRPHGSAVVVAIATDTGITTEAIGYGDVTLRDEATANTRFAIASITKSFVTAVVLLLADEGLRDLDAPLATYIGADLPVDPNDATIRHLLGNRSGIGEFWGRELLLEAVAQPDRRWTAREALSRAGPPTEPPGTRFRCCNTKWVLLGLLVEAVTGVPIGQLVHERLISPLELRGIVYQPDAMPAPPVARGLADVHRTGTLTPLPPSRYLPSLARVSLAGPAGSMAADGPTLVRWGHLLYRGKLLSERAHRDARLPRRGRRGWLRTRHVVVSVAGRPARGRIEWTNGRVHVAPCPRAGTERDGRSDS